MVAQVQCPQVPLMATRAVQRACGHPRPQHHGTQIAFQVSRKTLIREGVFVQDLTVDACFRQSVEMGLSPGIVKIVCPRDVSVVVGGVILVPRVLLRTQDTTAVQTHGILGNVVLLILMGMEPQATEQLNLAQLVVILKMCRR